MYAAFRAFLYTKVRYSSVPSTLFWDICMPTRMSSCPSQYHLSGKRTTWAWPASGLALATQLCFSGCTCCQSQGCALIGGSSAAKMKAVLPKQAEEVQQGLYQMPETSGEVPAIFMAADGLPEDNEVTAGEHVAKEFVLEGDAIVLD